MSLHTIMLPETTIKKFRQYSELIRDNNEAAELANKYAINHFDNPIHDAIQDRIKNCVSSVTHDVYLACKEAGYLD